MSIIAVPDKKTGQAAKVIFEVVDSDGWLIASSDCPHCDRPLQKGAVGIVVDFAEKSWHLACPRCVHHVILPEAQ
jgi:hypothetical protein